MTEKYKIYLSEDTKMRLINDAELFEFYRSDGSVNLKDVVLLRRALAGWDVTADPFNSDVDADGDADLADVVQITRCLAGGWGMQLQFSI